MRASPAALAPRGQAVREPGWSWALRRWPRGRKGPPRGGMPQFHHPIETVGAQGLGMRMQSLEAGCLSVPVFFSDGPAVVCGLSWLLTGPEGLDEAATAHSPPLAATLGSESVDAEIDVV